MRSLRIIGSQNRTFRQRKSVNYMLSGRRQHLAVSHEKGKVTLLQLSALLKQADASKRKLTLTRLSTTQMPFAVITITGKQLVYLKKHFRFNFLIIICLKNSKMFSRSFLCSANPCNEEVLAVCGLKDCHVLTFASSPQSTAPAGSVTQHLVLHPQLATNNYIIRAVWLPSFPTMLALITADFIKIYDLSKV